MAGTKFPIAVDWAERAKHPEWPTHVDWDKLLPYEWVAVRNHQQTLCTLASRGGLSPQELYCVINCLPCRGTAFPPVEELITTITAQLGLED